ncbi:hypothetical protein LguiA_036215 [Lonicera macranthoides]
MKFLQNQCLLQIFSIISSFDIPVVSGTKAPMKHPVMRDIPAMNRKTYSPRAHVKYNDDICITTAINDDKAGPKIEPTSLASSGYGSVIHPWGP